MRQELPAPPVATRLSVVRACTAGPRGRPGGHADERCAADMRLQYFRTSKTVLEVAPWSIPGPRDIWDSTVRALMPARGSWVFKILGPILDHTPGGPSAESRSKKK